MFKLHHPGYGRWTVYCLTVEEAPFYEEERQRKEKEIKGRKEREKVRKARQIYVNKCGCMHTCCI
jgi:hypothetical protein